jgi:hypothetical protein
MFTRHLAPAGASRVPLGRAGGGRDEAGNLAKRFPAKTAMKINFPVMTPRCRFKPAP